MHITADFSRTTVVFRSSWTRSKYCPSARKSSERARRSRTAKTVQGPCISATRVPRRRIVPGTHTGASASTCLCYIRVRPIRIHHLVPPPPNVRQRRGGARVRDSLARRTLSCLLWSCVLSAHRWELAACAFRFFLFSTLSVRVEEEAPMARRYYTCERRDPTPRDTPNYNMLPFDEKCGMKRRNGVGLAASCTAISRLFTAGSRESKTLNPYHKHPDGELW